MADPFESIGDDDDIHKSVVQLVRISMPYNDARGVLRRSVLTLLMEQYCLVCCLGDGRGL